MKTDTQPQKDVLSELSWEPSIEAANIGVAARDGVVTLTGSVGSFAEKHAVELAVREVKGVRDIAEEIEVRLPCESKLAEADIAAAAVSRLALNVSVPRDSDQVKVDKGWVTLTGSVTWQFEKEAAKQDVVSMLGVTELSNQIAKKPTSVRAMSAMRSRTHCAGHGSLIPTRSPSP